jgi:hypothetical protein
MLIHLKTGFSYDLDNKKLILKMIVLQLSGVIDLPQLIELK